DTWAINVDDSQMAAGGSLVHPLATNIVYSFGGGNVYRSTDGWAATSCTGIATTTQGQETVCTPWPGAANCTTNSNKRCYQRSCLPTSSQIQSDPGCPVSNDSNVINSLVVDPTIDPNNAHLIACADQGLYASTDGATTWGKMNPSGLPVNAS